MLKGLTSLLAPHSDVEKECGTCKRKLGSQSLVVCLDGTANKIGATVGPPSVESNVICNGYVDAEYVRRTTV